MKFRLLLSLSLIFMFMSSNNSIIAEHNEEFPINGCSDATQSIVITTTGTMLRFMIDGDVNPTLNFDKGSCLEATFQNTSEIDHDFTVEDESDSGEFTEIIHMEANAGTNTHHLWQLPDKDVTLVYHCEVPGHREAGEEGQFIIGTGSHVDSDTEDTSSGNIFENTSSDNDIRLPGFDLSITISGLFVFATFLIYRKRN
ncbi:MAG: hypothetical protein ACW99A_22145 [Candidatus Kariarchaeaceae archaeon]|jgi:uncharacterized cupredoxin-like copper-binding protein